MPTYQYACTECGHRLEAVQSFTDQPLVECPECAGRLRKVFSAVGVVFKGSGFYRTDSRATATNGSSANGSSSKNGKNNSSAGKDSSSSSSTSSSGTSGSGAGTSGSSGSATTAKSA